MSTPINKPIIVSFELPDETSANVVLHPRCEGSPKGRFSTGSSGFQGSDKVMDSNGDKYQINFQVVKIGSKNDK